jgi:hypothetical protein
LSVSGSNTIWGDAPAIAQVDEHAAPVIAASGHPAEEDGPLSGVAGAQGAAVVGSFEVDQKLGLRLGLKLGHDALM